jgi:hypothetical protein
MFHIFDFFSRTFGSIFTKPDINHPWWEGIQVCSNEREHLSPRGDRNLTENILKFFNSTSKPISIKLGTNYSLMKGIQVCPN